MAVYSRGRNAVVEYIAGTGIVLIAWVWAAFFSRPEWFEIITLAALCAAVLLGVVIYKWSLAQTVRWFHSHRNATALKQLSTDDFNEIVRLLYTRMGYKVRRVPRAHRHALQFVATLGDTTSYIRCSKLFSRPVSKDDLHEFSQVVQSLDTTGKKVFLTTYIFSSEAIDYAKQEGIEIINGDELAAMIRRDAAERTPAQKKQQARRDTCPKCGSPLVERYSGEGVSLICSRNPECDFTKKPN